MSFEIHTECACCGREIGFTMEHDLAYTLHDPASAPLYFLPMVDFTKLEAPSIVDDF